MLDKDVRPVSRADLVDEHSRILQVESYCYRKRRVRLDRIHLD